MAQKADKFLLGIFSPVKFFAIFFVSQKSANSYSPRKFFAGKFTQKNEKYPLLKE
jgi:hypothetical protein